MSQINTLGSHAPRSFALAGLLILTACGETQGGLPGALPESGGASGVAGASGVGGAAGAPAAGGTTDGGPSADGAAGVPSTGGGDAATGGGDPGLGGDDLGPEDMDTVGVYPPAGAMNMNPDTYLRITFDDKPTINTGIVEIRDASSGQLVDRVNVEMDTTKAGTRTRRDGQDLVTFLVDVVDNNIVINPHSEKLNYGTTYNVVIGSGVFSGRLNGQDYSGAMGTQWQFTTKASGPTGATVTVNDNGPADFSSVQGALDYIAENHGGSAEALVNVKDGVYLGVLGISGKSNLRVVGQSRDKTIVRARNSNEFNPGDNTRALLTISGGDLVSGLASAGSLEDGFHADYVPQTARPARSARSGFSAPDTPRPPSIHTPGLNACARRCQSSVWPASTCGS